MAFTLLGSIELALANQGVTIEINVQPETCGKGCTPMADVFADEADIPKVRDFFAAERKRTHGDIDSAADQLNQVFDTSKEDATCPACGTQFKTSAKECPDCGLVFISEGMEG
jgi:hypothetical protein